MYVDQIGRLAIQLPLSFSRHLTRKKREKEKNSNKIERKKKTLAGLVIRLPSHLTIDVCRSSVEFRVCLSSLGFADL